ncbi:hypothetical protein FQN60_012861 [Etheostoma spectabile]|uniref:Uncharacterized protein n=1 Tax=Etheostoma spectabile TaxID=54343 RepID=A0A5J5DA78_9PERO|nr:hypothetical protein FQN60_012861 [Etheostoma spectabile]
MSGGREEKMNNYCHRLALRPLLCECRCRSVANLAMHRYEQAVSADIRRQNNFISDFSNFYSFLFSTVFAGNTKILMFFSEDFENSGGELNQFDDSGKAVIMKLKENSQSVADCLAAASEVDDIFQVTGDGSKPELNQHSQKWECALQEWIERKAFWEYQSARQWPQIDTVDLNRQTMLEKREGGSGSSVRGLKMSAPYPSSPHSNQCHFAYHYAMVRGGHMTDTGTSFKYLPQSREEGESSTSLAFTTHKPLLPMWLLYTQLAQFATTERYNTSTDGSIPVLLISICSEAIHQSVDSPAHHITFPLHSCIPPILPFYAISSALGGTHWKELAEPPGTYTKCCVLVISDIAEAQLPTAFTLLSSYGMYPLTSGAPQFKERIRWVKSTSGTFCNALHYLDSESLGRILQLQITQDNTDILASPYLPWGFDSEPKAKTYGIMLR